jgi:proton-dependent oligopeptide transporter, POT family
VTKIGIGSAIVAIAALLFAYGNLGKTAADSVGAGWALAGWLIMGLGWMYYWPTTLALVSKSVPPAVAGRLMGVAFLSPFIGHTLMGWVGSYFDQVTPSLFWTIDAAIAAVGAVIILILRNPLRRGLEPAIPKEMEHRC